MQTVTSLVFFHVFKNVILKNETKELEVLKYDLSHLRNVSIGW